MRCIFVRRSSHSTKRRTPFFSAYLTQRPGFEPGGAQDPAGGTRQAWLFAGRPRGGQAAAVAFSLIETVKLNRVEPFACLKDVLTRIRSHRVDRLGELLPFNWKPAA